MEEKLAPKKSYLYANELNCNCSRTVPEFSPCYIQTLRHQVVVHWFFHLTGLEKWSCPFKQCQIKKLNQKQKDWPCK